MAQDELVHAGPGAPALDALNSPDWWHNRSHDELQAIFQRGIQAGDLFVGAATEMERRAREAEAARDAEQVQEIRTDRRLRWEMWALLVLAVVTILLLMLRGG